jgi:hypothetical protein
MSHLSPSRTECRNPVSKPSGILIAYYLKWKHWGSIPSPPIKPLLNWAPHREDIFGGVDVWLHSFLTLALDGREYSASCPGLFNPEGIRRYPLHKRSGLGHRDDKIPLPCPCRKSNLGHPAYTYWAIPATVLPDLYESQCSLVGQNTS